MLYLLGQSVKIESKTPVIPGIVTGHNSWGQPLVTYIGFNGDLVLNEFFTQSNLSPLREKKEDTPEGMGVYYGSLCRGVALKGINMKLPTVEKIKAELEKSKQYL